jgi:hypothetical protein
MVAPVDLHAIEAHFVSASAEVRLARVQGENAELAAERVAQYLRALADSREGFSRLLAEISDGTRTMCEADQFFSDEERAAIRRVERLFRLWAPRFAVLRAPETDPLALSFPAWFRSYNDALTKLVRAMLDCACKLDERLAEEETEDADSAEWTRPPSDEDLVAWSDVRAQVFPSGSGN